MNVLGQILKNIHTQCAVDKNICKNEIRTRDFTL